MSSKKLLEQCSKLEKLWPHVFTTTLELESGDGWYNQLVDLIEKQQTAPIWMSETKVRRSGRRFVTLGAIFVGAIQVSSLLSPEDEMSLTLTFISNRSCKACGVLLGCIPLAPRGCAASCGHRPRERPLPSRRLPLGFRIRLFYRVRLSIVSQFRVLRAR